MGAGPRFASKVAQHLKPSAPATGCKPIRLFRVCVQRGDAPSHAPSVIRPRHDALRSPRLRLSRPRVLWRVSKTGYPSLALIPRLSPRHEAATSVTTPILRLRTLGVLDLQAPDGSELRSVLAQPRRVALLVYLALAT